MERQVDDFFLKKALYIYFLFVVTTYYAQQSSADSSIVIIEPLHALNSGKSEYAPFFWRNKLYFISNRNNHFALYLSDKISRNGVSGVFQPEKEPGTYAIPQHLAHKINSKYNEGPFCFVEKGIYITCNQYNRSFSGKGQPLEIRFSSFDAEKGFTEAKRISIDLPDSVSFGHPAIMGDSLMVFVAKMQGEKGNTDLYYSFRKDKRWQRPVPVTTINSSADEMFPFYSNGYLYFSSNREGGYGKLDIYKSKVNGVDFGIPELMKSPINSTADDFGMWIDPGHRWGYFTSNRSNTEDDLYWVSFDPPIFENCKIFEKPNYCFLFYEESGIESKDTLGMYYEWSFGDGVKARGLEVKHCFPGPGKYKVELNIVDKSSGAVFYNQVSYDFFIEGDKVVYFDIPDTVQVEKPVIFAPQLYSRNKGQARYSYHWSFGDHNNSNKTITPHIYKDPGHYTIKLSVFESKGDSVFRTCVEKNIHVSAPGEPVHNNQAFTTKKNEKLSAQDKNLIRNASAGSSSDSILVAPLEAGKGKTPTWKYDPLYRINEEDTTYNYKVHLGISPNMLSPNDTVFKGLSPISYNKINDLYHYSFGNVHKLAESKPLYNQARSKGFENAIVVAFKGDSMIFGSNMENIFKLIGDSIKLPNRSDTVKNISFMVFFSNGKHVLSDEAKRQLDRILDQSRNRFIKTVRITGHTDDSGSLEINDKISLQRAMNVAEYFIKKGMDKSLIQTTYKGSKQPLLPGNDDKNRDYNRRVEIEIYF